MSEELTLRDRLALAAPPAPEWFEPEMPPRPERPEPPANLGERALLLLTYWRDLKEEVRSGNDAAEGVRRGRAKWGSSSISADEEKALVEYEAAWFAAGEAQRSYATRTEAARLIQWPYAWADMQLARRNAVVPDV